MSVCKYCNQEKPLCKAHIIPQAFYKQIWDDPLHPHLLKIKEGTNSFKSSPVGIYDPSILCHQCDTKIGTLDQYGIDFFSRIDAICKKIKFSTNSFYYIIEGTDFDYIKLKKFFVSILYRASISTIPDCSKISLGIKYENEAKEFLQGNTDNTNFSIIMYKRISQTELPADKFIMFPTKMRFKKDSPISGFNAYDMSLCGYRIIIKVDQRAYNKTISMFEMSPKGIRLLHEKLEETKDFDFMVKTVNNKK